jgi:UDP-glucose 4-epimerase
MSRCLIYQRPIHVYVPLTTIRDYIFVHDCAWQIIDCCRELLQAGHEGRVVKLFSSEQSMSLAQIVGVFARIARRSPRIVCSSRPCRTEQPAALHFRSKVWPDVKVSPGTNLPVGIDRLHRHQLGLFLRGQLPPPAEV